MAKPGNNRASNTFYQTYRFSAREKDPIIDQVRTMMDDTGTSVRELSEKTHLSESTVRNWIDGDTRKPQFASISAAVIGMGFEFAIIRRRRKISGAGLQASAPRLIADSVTKFARNFIPTGPSPHHIAGARARFNEK